MYEGYKPKKGLLAKLIEWDEDREAYIAHLEAENKELQDRLAETAYNAFEMAETSDRMKLELIMSGALIKPKKEEQENIPK